jgi:hypothetical protein
MILKIELTVTVMHFIYAVEYGTRKAIEVAGLPGTYTRTFGIKNRVLFSLLYLLLPCAYFSQPCIAQPAVQGTTFFQKSELREQGCTRFRVGHRNQNINPALSEPAASYLHNALDLMKKSALHRKEIDWHQVERAATAFAAGAHTTADTYPAIAFACTRLEDHSSHLQVPFNTLPSVQERVRAIEQAAMNAQHGEKLLDREKSPFVGRSAFLLALLTYQGTKVAYLAIPRSNTSHTEYADAERAS